ncbi:MAG: glycoside hydrolase family 36 protein [Mobilitalea sp.]
MKTTVLNEYHFGDMICKYYIDNETKNVELMLLPAGKKPVDWERKNQAVEALVQLKLVGDTYLGGYAGGGTMRQGESVTLLKYKEQRYETKDDREEVVTILIDERGYEVEHYLRWYKNSKSVDTFTKFYNHCGATVTLEMISSFSLGGITPFTEGDAYDTLKVHRLRSVWSMEGRLESKTIEELQLEPSWAGHAVRSERFGQVGSMAVNHYFPYLAMEDTENDVFWGAQLAHNASWQMEIYRRDDGISISGGLADREFGHWMKEIGPEECFITPTAILSVCKGGGIDNISQRLTSAGTRLLDQAPKSEKNLPIIFNEYCTTWGCPSHENITGILKAIKGKGFGYFVIDCGWYKEDGIPWDIAMGDYQVSKDLFPEGLDKTLEAIRDADMMPGIWFEIENVGSASKAYQNEEHLLKRDDKTLTTTMRRFWDMRDPWVEKYLTEKVIEMLQKYNFSYMKIDYNDTIGLGCDGAESIGEGLRQNMEASFEFIEKVKREVPGIILENCASGGHRLDPLMMGACSMASFSDAHECEEIPIIAANLHRAILPRQSQIWAVIRKEDSLKRIAYSIANTFLGRMCLSGDVMELGEDQWKVIDLGIAFYKKIAPIICDGYTFRFGTEISSYRHPKGWQGILRIGSCGDAYALFHVFDGILEEKYSVEIPQEYEFEVGEVYSDADVEVTLMGRELSYKPTENRKAVAVYLKKRDE